MEKRKEDEAKQHMVEGDKHCSTGFFKKANWEAAASSYGKAGVAYKVAKKKNEAKEAFKKCANAHNMFASLYHAGKNLELAAQMAEDKGEAAQLLEKAAEFYKEGGNLEKAATSLYDAGMAVAEEDGDKAVQYYQQAISLNDDKLDQRIYSAMFVVLLRLGKKTELVEAMEKLMERWIKKSNNGEAHRLATAMVVIELSRDDVIKAERTYSSLLGDVPGYMQSDTGEHCGDMLEAYKNNNVEAFVALQKSSKFNYMETCVVRLFKSIKLQTQEQMDGEDIDMT